MTGKPFGPAGLDRQRGQKPEEMLQLVAFTVGAGQYALDIMRIKEIINPVTITRVPKAPPFIEGVIELRGAILPIVDLRKRFELPAGALDRASKFVIVGIDVGGRRMIVGLIVDGVLEPLRVSKDQIRPAPPLVAGMPGEAAYFSGVVQRRRAERADRPERPEKPERPDKSDRPDPRNRGLARRGDADAEDERIFMLLDLDAILSSKEKVSLAGLDGATP
jgi:purine-binding chemotaxis protein CheW